MHIAMLHVHCFYFLQEYFKIMLKLISHLRTCTVYSSNTNSTISSEVWYPTPQWMKMGYFSQQIQQMLE